MDGLSDSFAARVATLHPAYLAFLGRHVDELTVGEVRLDGRAYLEEHGEILEMAEYLPGYVAIGDEGGSDVFVMGRDGSPAVWRVGPGALFEEELEAVHASFADWLDRGCPLAG